MDSKVTREHHPVSLRKNAKESRDAYLILEACGSGLHGLHFTLRMGWI